MRLAGIEPAARGLGGRCSVLLSYRRILWVVFIGYCVQKVSISLFTYRGTRAHTRTSWCLSDHHSISSPGKIEQYQDSHGAYPKKMDSCNQKQQVS